MKGSVCSLATKEDICIVWKEIVAFKTEIIRWMFILSISQVVAIWIFLSLFLKK
jgi:hypothetical protein